MPRAGKLHEFLSPEEDTDSTSDSTGSFYRTPQVPKQRGRWDVLESLFQSDPDSDLNDAEDEEDLESLLYTSSSREVRPYSLLGILGTYWGLSASKRKTTLLSVQIQMGLVCIHCHRKRWT